uniref:EKC/KEOPS complex subunit GON7-like n=1 Tax=Geotrypetes seraphini TaxID=260995 RepID=A0A6P8RRY3_GEOSA|nr:EKC/KEOPS complex subunit GON7-like [Geotrypetes seraphini]
MELEAELTGRDGGRRSFRPRRGSCSLRDLVAGLARLKEEVSVALSELVAQEKNADVSGAGDQESADEEEEDEDEEEEENTTSKARANGPLAKRTKFHQPGL